MYILLETHIACLCLSISILLFIRVCVCVCVRVCVKSLQLCLTLWDPVDCSLPGCCVMGFSKQEYWSGLPCLPPGDLPSPGTELKPPGSPALQVVLTTSSTWEAHVPTYQPALHLSNPPPSLTQPFSLSVSPLLPPSFIFSFPFFLHFLFSLSLPLPSSHPSFHPIPTL